MVKVKNKVLIALSILLCAILFSSIFVFNDNTKSLNAETETQSQSGISLQNENVVNFPKNWATQVASLQGQTLNDRADVADYTSTITSIIFAKEVPSGYSLIKEDGSTIEDGLPVYQKDGDSTKIAFVYNGTIKAPTDCSALFGGTMSNDAQIGNTLINLETLQFDDNFDVSEVTSIEEMFSCMASGAQSNLDILGFEKLNFTANLTNMTRVFFCRNKKFSIDFSNINTSYVTDMSYMFWSCGQQTYIDVSHFDTSRVTNFNAIFGGCVQLSTINVGNFNTEKAEDMSSMFSNCSNLKSIIFSNSWTVKNVTTLSSMFSSCSSLEQIDLSNMTNCTSSVTDMSDMFNGCSNLKSVKFSDNFIVNDLTDMNNLFRNCGSLTSIDLSGIKFSANLEDASGLFYNCTSLKTVNLSGWDLSNTDTSNMFKLLGKVDGVARTSSLTKVILPSAVADDIELPTSWSTELTNKGATKYCITTDETKTAVTTIDSTLLENYAGGTLELYTDSGESLATPQTPVEPATGVNASVVAIVCSVIAILMIVVAYVVISNKKNNKRKVNAININISKKN